MPADKNSDYIEKMDLAIRFQKGCQQGSELQLMVYAPKHLWLKEIPILNAHRLS